MTPAVSVARAKLRPPALPNPHVARPRLQRVLDAVPPGGMGVLVGPAGIGKTTLVREWIETVEGRSCWVQLDALDRDPVRWWTAAMASILGAFPEVGAGAAGIVSEGRPPGPEEVQQLVEEVAASGDELVMVYDELHHIGPTTVFDGDMRVLGPLPDNVRLVVTSRTLPPWPLVRMRAAGLVVELDMDDLRLDEAESRALLGRLLDDDLPDALVRRLVEKSEGWAAAVHLAGTDLRRHRADPATYVDHFSGAIPAMAEMLTSELLDGQDDDVVDLLVETASLELLTPDACDAVAARSRSGRVLRRAHEAQLVQQIDDLPDTWRAPRLLRDLLADRLRARGARRSYASAAAWYTATGLPEQAARSAMAADDPELSYALFAASAPWLAVRGSPELAVAWSRTLGDDVLDARPDRRLEVAWALGLAGELGDATSHTTAAVRSSQGYDPALLTCLQWWAAIAMGDMAVAETCDEELAGQADRTHLAFRLRWLVRTYALTATGDLAAAYDAFEEGAADMDAGGAVPTAVRIAALAELLLGRGEVRVARRLAQEALGSWEETRLPPSRFLLPAMRAHAGVEIEDGDLDLAAGILDVADAVAGHGGTLSVHVVLDVAMRASLLRAQGRPGEALVVLDDAHRHAAVAAGPRASAWFEALLASEEVRARIDLGDLAGAERALDVAAPRPERDLLAARLLLERGDPAAAASVLHTAATPTTRLHLEACLLRARLATADEAEALLAATVEEASVHGYHRTLAQEVALHDAYRSLYRTAPTLAVGRLVRGTDPWSRTLPAALVEPLTARELDVLRLLPSHLTNQEIAGTLNVSLNTVKTHVKSIYRKLGVEARSPAVEHARRLGVIDPNERGRT